MDNPILIGVFGSLVGAIIGGLLTMWGVGIQIGHQNKIALKEKEEKEKIAVKIIMRFIWRELDNNYRILIEWQQKKFLELKLLFREYSYIKYEFVKYDVEVIGEIMDLYDMFLNLQDGNKTSSLSYQKADDEISKIINKRESLISEIEKYTKINF